MALSQKAVRILVSEGDSVSGVLVQPQKTVSRPVPAVVLAHGAGGGIDDPMLRYIQVFLGGRGYATLRFNFPYREKNRKVPDREELLERTVQCAVDFLKQQPGVNGGQIFLGGKSMGGRMASHLAAHGVPASGLLLLAYPLHAPGRPDRVRDQHLGAIKVPTLFISGTRDALAPQESLAAVVETLRLAQLSWVDGGDHSFKMLKKSGKTAEDVWQAVSEAAAEWLDAVVQRRIVARPTRPSRPPARASAAKTGAARTPKASKSNGKTARPPRSPNSPRRKT